MSGQINGHGFARENESLRRLIGHLVKALHEAGQSLEVISQHATDEKGGFNGAGVYVPMAEKIRQHADTAGAQVQQVLGALEKHNKEG